MGMMQSDGSRNSSMSMSSSRRLHWYPVLMTYDFGGGLNQKRMFRMWVKTLEYAGFDFVIIGDQSPNYTLPPNVRYYPISWDGLLGRIYNTTFHGRPPEELVPTMSQIPRYYKVCDYKPLMGHLFPELIQDYDWWGHIDNDVLVGNLTKFFPKFRLSANIVFKLF